MRQICNFTTLMIFFFDSLCISVIYWNFHVFFQSDYFFLSNCDILLSKQNILEQYHSSVNQVTDLLQLCKTDTFSSSQHTYCNTYHVLSAHSKCNWIKVTGTTATLKFLDPAVSHAQEKRAIGKNE